MFRFICRLTIAVAAFSVAALSQDPHYTYPFELECDAVGVTGGTVGCAVKFPSEADAKRYQATWNWTVSAGVIESGQGTAAIRLQIPGDHPGGSIYVTAERSIAEAVFPGIQNTATASISVADRPEAKVLAEIPTIGSNCEIFLMEIDSYIAYLANNPMDHAYVIIYVDPSRAGSGHWVETILKRQVRSRKFDQSRVTITKGPVRTGAVTQFWSVPPGAESPETLPANAAVPPATPVKEPFVWATDASDGLPECAENQFDIREFAAVLKSEPSYSAKVVIHESSPAAYQRKANRILRDLARAGVAGSRIRTTYTKAESDNFRYTELWIVPAKTPKK